jgi:RNA polymerase sigma factor (sigma-70 family)
LFVQARQESFRFCFSGRARFAGPPEGVGASKVGQREKKVPLPPLPWNYYRKNHFALRGSRMTRTATGPLLQMLRGVVEDPRVKELPDRELLRLFSNGQDEAAFQGLLRRHGPMVLDVCRNVLGNDAEAEDAFQATFLILAQKAASIRKTASVGSWLHGVAYRTALKARAEFARRQKHENRKSSQTKPALSDDLSWRDVQQVVHAELDRLSERYRAPLVLCYLQGKTQDEAALVLGVSKTTLKKHLESARSLLRARLVRRGLGPALLLLAGAWPGAKASAALPPALVSSTVKAATRLAAGHAAAGLVSTKVAALTEKVLKAMFLTKVRITTAVVLAFAMVTLFGGWAIRGHRESGGAVAAAPAPGPDKPAPANKDGEAPKPADAKKDENPLQGEWAKTETKQSGRIRLVFDGKPNPASGSKSLVIRWTSPGGEGAGGAAGGLGGGVGFGGGIQGGGFGGGVGFGGGAGGPGAGFGGGGAGAPGAGFGGGGLPGGGVGFGGGAGAPGGGVGFGGGGGIQGGGFGGGAPGGGGGFGGPGMGGFGGFGGGRGNGRGATVSYECKEKDGKTILVLKVPNQEDFEVPYKLDGDTLTFDGGVYKVGGQGGRPAFLEVEFKGEWKRVDTALEDKLRKAFPGVDVDGFSIKVELRGQRLVLAANKVTIQPDGHIRFEDCAVARLPVAQEGAKPGSATAVRSDQAVFQLDKPIRTIADLGSGTILTVDFGNGVRMNLKE